MPTPRKIRTAEERALYALESAQRRYERAVARVDVAKKASTAAYTELGEAIATLDHRKADPALQSPSVLAEGSDR
jgi:hypothetical protein